MTKLKFLWDIEDVLHVIHRIYIYIYIHIHTHTHRMESLVCLLQYN